ncbi:MAG TPA: AarF/UbiB family protein [Longimicrobiaceae bacterium]|nr:AarF/UbiB family protein [Longimicrobiaceae bacterium]
MNRLRRSWTIVRSLAPFVMAFVRDRHRWVLVGRPRRLTEAQHRERARRLVDTVARLGPTFIKLAQVFSARADVLPEPYLSEVGRLQDNVPPVPVEAIEAVLVAEMGRPPGEIFEAFDREPLASASLGQVYRARLDGQEVAVKVLRPGVDELIAVDLDISFRILFFLNILFPNHHVRALTAVFREFERRIQEETDLREEAANTEQFRRLFSDDPRVRAPRVVEEYTRRRVMVSEFVQATKVDRLQDAFASGALSFARLMETLVEAYLRMMMVDGFLHADPHPGNILVEDDGTIVFLDFGMVVRVERSTRERIIRIALAAAREDVDGIINGMYELGMIDPEISRAEIRDAAVRIMDILQQVRELEPRRVQEMVQEILDTFYTWPLILPQELVYFFRAAALLEGIGFRYDPHFNGLDVVKPVVRRMGPELMTGTSRAPREVARDVLGQAEHTIRALYDLVSRAEREELRLRAHPRDVLQYERFAGLMVRRLLLGLFASVMAVVCTLVYVATHQWWILLLGNAVALFLFLVVLLIPKHLLENPLRRVREVRRSARIGR